mgnify:CR=1 FL=1
MVITCFADEVQQTFRFNLEEAEMLLSDRARRNEKFTAADYVFLSRVGWDQKKAHDEYRRVTQALNQQAIAGSPADREAALLESQTAAEIHAKESPKLEARISELTAKLNGLERDQRLSQKRVEQQREAVVKCREFVPLYVRQSVDAARTNLLTSGSGKALRDAEARRHELVCTLNVGGIYDRQEKHIDTLSRLLPVAVAQTVQGRMISYRYSDQWAGLKADAEREFDSLNQQLPELQSVFDADLDVVEKPLDYWSNPPADG